MNDINDWSDSFVPDEFYTYSIDQDELTTDFIKQDWSVLRAKASVRLREAATNVPDRFFMQRIDIDLAPTFIAQQVDEKAADCLAAQLALLRFVSVSFNSESKNAYINVPKVYTLKVCLWHRLSPPSSH